MSTNTDIKYNDFNNICRTCMITSDLKPLNHNNVIIQVLHNLTDISFETNDELPQQICTKCYEKIIEINAFALQCKQTYLCLTKSLDEFKIEIKEEIIIEDEEQKPVMFEEVLLVPDISSTKFENEEKTNDTNMFEVTPTKKNKKNQHQCESCGKIFTQSSSLVRHKRIHSCEKPYKCPTCLKSFNTSSNLNVHQRIHTGIKSYKCESCDKAFTDKSNLKIHSRIHSGFKPHKCDICSKCFIKGSHLKRHVKVHTNEYDFACKICAKKFKLAHNLSEHMFVHINERNFHCLVCNKGFKDPNTLRKHKRIHC